MGKVFHLIRINTFSSFFNDETAVLNTPVNSRLFGSSVKIIKLLFVKVLIPPKSIHKNN